MKIISSKSSFKPGILLFLLLLGLVASTFSMHNLLLSLGGNIPILPVIFIIITIICALLLFQSIVSLSNLSAKKTEQLESLKKTIEQYKTYEKEKQSKEEAEVTTVVVDTEAESKALIPTETFDKQELFAESLLSNIAKKYDIVQGLMFLKNDKNKFTFTGGYAFFSEEDPREFTEGETLSGQVAKNKLVLNLTSVPENYITILSGLGKGSPKHLMIVPIINTQNECVGIIELASFKAFGNNEVEIFKLLGLSLGEFFESSSQSSKE